MTGRDTVPVARSNAGFSVFAEEGKKVTTKKASRTALHIVAQAGAEQEKVRQVVDDAAIAELEAKQAEQAGQEQQEAEQAQAQAVTVKPLTQKQEREALRAAGLRVCNRHVKYLDRLPDEAKVAVEGHPVEVRPLSEFASGATWSSPCCKPCYKIYDGEWREAHKAPGALTTRARSEAILARKITQRNQLNAEIEALQASLAQQ